MKIALLGTCQMEQISLIIKDVIAQIGCSLEILQTETAAHRLNMGNAVEAMIACAKADRIYCQYFRTFDGSKAMWSTEVLQKYFNVKVVPLLLSPISSPQLYHWSEPYPHDENFQHNWSIDFRFLEFFLQGTTAEKASCEYQSLVIPCNEIELGIAERTAAYRKRYDSGLICFDYSEFYQDQLLKDTHSYSVFSHPKNIHLVWLANQILEDCGINCSVSLCSEKELLLNSKAPNLFGKGRESYLFNSAEEEILTIAKFFYGYFETLERSWLTKEYLNSTYYRKHRSLSRITTIKDDVHTKKPNYVEYV